jgi:uncharacterized membrane protein
MKEFISRVYKWFYEEVMCRKEPYTYQLCRQMIHHGIFFWIGYYIISGYLFYYLFFGVLWQLILSVIFLIILAWLIDHLIDSVRLNPERYDD